MRQCDLNKKLLLECADGSMCGMHQAIIGGANWDAKTGEGRSALLVAIVHHH